MVNEQSSTVSSRPLRNNCAGFGSTSIPVWPETPSRSADPSEPAAASPGVSVLQRDGVSIGPPHVRGLLGVGLGCDGRRSGADVAVLFGRQRRRRCRGR